MTKEKERRLKLLKLGIKDRNLLLNLQNKRDYK